MKLLIILFVISFFNYSISTLINKIETNNSIIRNWERKVSEFMSTANIERAALGRVASLGDLYDVRKDQFIEISLYNSKVSRDTIHVTDIPNSNIEFIRSENFNDKMYSLGISSGLAISFWVGLVPVKGSAGYLNVNTKSSKSAKTSIRYSVRTVQENLKIFSAASVKLMNTDLLTRLDATHIVVGIQWGADVIMSLEETASDSSNVRYIHGKLKGSINAVLAKVSASAGITITPSKNEKRSSFNLMINGDIVPNEVPQTLNDAAAFIQNIPKLVNKTNGGKGKIMRFILMPIENAERMLEKVTKGRRAAQDLGQDPVNQFMQIFQELSDAKLQINDVYNDIAKWADMVPEKDFAKITKLKNNLQMYVNDLKLDFTNLVVQFRSGNINGEDLKNRINDYQTSEYTPAKIEESLRGYESTLRKHSLLDLFERFDARFIGRTADRHKTLISNFEQEIGIISLDLGTNVSSHYIRNIVRLLKVEVAKKAKKIKDEAEKVKTRNIEEKTKNKNVEELNPQTFRAEAQYEQYSWRSNTTATKPVDKTKGVASKQNTQAQNTGKPTKKEDIVKPITYYIRHDPHLTVPNITIYLQGKIQKTHLIDKKEYILAVSESGKVIIMDARTYDQVVTYKEPNLEKSTFAIVNEVLYNIAIKKGRITCTRIENIFQNPGNMTWDHVGSFPNESCDLRSVAAVHGSILYFVTCDGYIYKYDMVLKTVTKCGQAVSGAVTSHLVTVGEIIYIQKNETFYSLKGTELKTIDAKPARKSPGLFEFRGKACQVGGEPNTAYKHPVRCYDPAREEWFKLGYINHARQNPGVVDTSFGTIIFGGEKTNSQGKVIGKLESAEIFNHKTKTWSYIALPSTMDLDLYSASSFNF